ncbi:MAG TPA: gluconeogenesis factor YvcK family protein [Thermoclostridium sp.]|nr:gluconeogenesis factor YvcK family protein [Thermoclostridium sp.]
MNPLKLLSATYKYRRWLSKGFVGLLFILAGIISLVYKAEIEAFQLIVALLLCGIGIVLSFLCFKEIILALLRFNNNGLHHPPQKMLDIGKKIYQHTQLREGPQTVVIGGGTGISTLLRGLKQFTSNISAIITVADDGGGSGMLRKDMGILPPGDIRNCILALSDTEPQMEKLLQYRFKDGELKGQCFGNLFLAAMTGIGGSFEAGVLSMSEVLAVTGKVLPVTSENINLIAELGDGTIINGESRIGHHNNTHPGRIKRVYLDKDNVRPLESAIDAIENATVIILGPGSLYTSIIPNLLVEDVVQSIAKSKAVKIYVANVMTQPGETDGYSVYDHINAIYQHCGVDGFIDYCIVNKGKVPEKIYKRYVHDGASMVRLYPNKVKRLGIEIVECDLLQIDKGYVRHDPTELAKVVLEISNQR